SWRRSPRGPSFRRGRWGGSWRRSWTSSPAPWCEASGWCCPGSGPSTARPGPGGRLGTSGPTEPCGCRRPMCRRSGRGNRSRTPSPAGAVDDSPPGSADRDRLERRVVRGLSVGKILDVRLEVVGPRAVVGHECRGGKGRTGDPVHEVARPGTADLHVVDEAVRGGRGTPLDREHGGEGTGRGREDHGS